MKDSPEALQIRWLLQLLRPSICQCPPRSCAVSIPHQQVQLAWLEPNPIAAVTAIDMHARVVGIVERRERLETSWTPQPLPAVATGRPDVCGHRSLANERTKFSRIEPEALAVVTGIDGLPEPSFSDQGVFTAGTAHAQRGHGSPKTGTLHQAFRGGGTALSFQRGTQHCADKMWGTQHCCQHRITMGQRGARNIRLNELRSLMGGRWWSEPNDR